MAQMLKKIPWPSRSGNTSAHSGEDNHDNDEQEEGESLTTILTSEEDRSALTILVAECTAHMRQSIVDIFDAKQTGKKEDVVADLTGDQALQSPHIDPGDADVVARQDKMRQELAQRQKELSGPKFQQLKTAALDYFDEWRDRAIERVGEVVNSRAKAREHQHTSQPRKSPEEAAAEQSAPPMKFPEPTKYDEAVDTRLVELFPPVDTPLKELLPDKRALILHSLLLLLLSLEHYHAYSRILMLRMTTSLRLSISVLGQDESKVARTLLTAAENMQADEETKKKAEDNKTSRRWKVGLATAAGAALIGVTGGLAAPLLAAGIGSVMGGLGLGATAAAGYLGTLAGSSVLVGGLFGAYGGRMTSKVMDQYAREVEDFGFEPIRSAHRPRKIEKEFRRLRVGIGTSGWLTKQDDVVEPWKPLGLELESFALRWELEALMNLGNSLSSMVKSAVWTVAKKEIIQRTVFAALAAGLWPLALVKASRIIDNPWSVASHRAQKAGEVLCDALINKAQGERPVTLVGYSLGAKVIFACLQQLAERKAFGLIESVVLIGAPTPSTPADWRMIRSVVAGRVVNVYSTQDYILAFLHRGSSIQFGVAGLQAIENVKGIESVDASDMVKEGGHTSYRLLTGAILRKIGFEDMDYGELEAENAELRKEEERDEKAREEAESREAAGGGGGGGGGPAGGGKAGDVSEQHISELERQVQEKNERSYLGWAQQQMVAAGVNTSVAYEHAKAQWRLRSQGKSGQAAAATAKGVEGAAGDVQSQGKSAGVDAPSSGELASSAIKANSDAREAA